MDCYKIITNRNNRKILVIYAPLNVEICPDIKKQDFDAIFVDMADAAYDVNRLAIWKSSPILFDKCWLKPQFVSERLRNHIRMTQHIVDGYAVSPLDESFTSSIEDILGYITELGLSTDAAEIRTANDFFCRLCQFALSRRISYFTTTVLNGLASGYTLLNAALFESQETTYKQERLHFNQTLQEMRYAFPVRFVEKVHLCPKCKHSHIYFAECCPSCKSSNIVSESVIHHFRCANVSPESEYVYDEELRCPKCKHILRHIGVDYDRPASVYHCKECGKQFLHSDMKVTCSSCKNVSNPSELIHQDIYEYAFTPEGVKALVTGHIFLMMEKEVFSGYVDFEHFIRSLAVNLYSSTTNDNVYSIIRFSVSEILDLRKFVKVILARLPFSKLTIYKNRFYILVISEKLQCEEDLINIEKIVSSELETKTQSYKIDRYILETQLEVETFIKEQKRIIPKTNG